MLKKILEERNKPSAELIHQIDQVMQLVAADAQSAGLSIVDATINSFTNYAPTNVMKEWRKLNYNQILKIVKELAKEY